MSQSKAYRSFRDFYPFYLSEHRHPICRRLHVIGSLCVLSLIVVSIVSQYWWGLLAAPLCGYGFAWVGHFAFEKNKPATFDYPLYSFIGDFVMFKDYIFGRITR